MAVIGRGMKRVSGCLGASSILAFIRYPKAAVVVRSSEQSVAFFRQDERVMKAVLKTTKDRSEVYLTTLHVSDESAIRRALKKNAVIKNEYGGV